MDNSSADARQPGSPDPREQSADHAWRILVADELAASRKTLIYIQDRIDDLRQSMEKRFDQHEAYHQQNEFKWGPTKLFEGHPGKLIFVAIILLIATAANITVEQVMAILQVMPVEP